VGEPSGGVGRGQWIFGKITVLLGAEGLGAFWPSGLLLLENGSCRWQSFP